LIKEANAPPPSYPGLPGAVTKAPDWAIRNAPFDVVAYFTAPADNAAPLYLDALFEFDPEDMMDCLSPEVVARRERATKEKIERANTRLTAMRKEKSKDITPMEFDEVVADYENGFRLLSAAQERKGCMFETGPGHLAQWPHLQAARKAGDIVGLRIFSSLKRGDIDGAIAGVKVLLRLSRDVRSRSAAVGALVSISLDGRVCRDIIPQILAAPDLTKAQCDRLAAALRQHEAGPDLVIGILQGEYLMLRSALRPEVSVRLLRELAAHRDYYPGVEPSVLTQTADYAARMTPEDFEAQIAALSDWYRSLERLSQAPRQSRDQQLPQILDDVLRSRSLQLPGRNAIVAVFLPAVDALFGAVDRQRAFHRGSQCLIALRRWQLEHNSQPTDLESVVKPAGMTGVPIDPFSDAPLKMTAVNGETVIYSVGPDGQDDRAMVEWDPKVDPKKGDIVFRLPPAADRIRPVKPAARTWADKTGAHSITAELIEVKEGSVRLKRQDGKIVTIPVEKLSDADQAYLRDHAHASTVTPP
jgi:hypothetical protein